MNASLPKGTRDFGPNEMQQRNYILSCIKKYFLLYGFEQIETPAMENLSTLTGKYGEEGDQLLFKILNSRIHESKKKDELLVEFEKSLEKPRNSEALTERALRYDLTVPFARFVVMNQHKLSFPFKRFQIQPVWRADKPQRGRYREFIQCDADVIGSNSLLNEVDLIAMMNDVYGGLKIPALIKLNNRKILSGIAEIIDAKEFIIDITVAIDKIEKIGIEKVNEELLNKGLSQKSLTQLQPLFQISGNNTKKLSKLKEFLKDNEIGNKGIEELEYVLKTCENLLLQHVTLEIDFTLARGLNYYTGSIIEVKCTQGSISSSITGGGRYDDLTGIFGLKGMSGVGISFGIDRIFDVMQELNLFPPEISEHSTTKILLTNFGKTEEEYCIQITKKLRENGIATELYPEASKMKKQFDYADKKKIPFVGIIGSDEMNTGILSLKNMKTGEQSKMNFNDMLLFLKKN